MRVLHCYVFWNSITDALAHFYFYVNSQSHAAVGIHSGIQCKQCQLHAPMKTFTENNAETFMEKKRPLTSLCDCCLILTTSPGSEFTHSLFIMFKHFTALRQRNPFGVGNC